MQSTAGQLGAQRSMEGEQAPVQRPPERVAPPSRLFAYTILSPVDDVDKAWAPRYQQLQELVENMPEVDAKNILVQKVTSSQTGQLIDLVLGLLYGMLVSPEYAPKCWQFLRAMQVQRMTVGVACDNLTHVVNHRYPELLPTAKRQLVWVLGQFARDGTPEAEPLIRNMLRWMAGGDVTKDNMDLVAGMLSLLSENKAYVGRHPQLVSHSIYTYLRLIADHRDHRELRAREANYCAEMITAHQTECFAIGRELIRVLQDCALLPVIRVVWERLLKQPSAIENLLATPTSKDILTSRLTPRMEQWINFLYSKVAEKRSKRHMDWFVDRYLHRPATAETLVPDLIRYSCCVFQPTNVQLQQKMVPRWLLISRLLPLIQSTTVAVNAKLALFFDWMFYKQGDNIMHIEPAALLLQNLVGMPRTEKLSAASLLEFLCLISKEYYQPMTSRLQQSIAACFTACMDMGIIAKSPRLLDSRESLGPEVMALLRQTLSGLYPTRDHAPTHKPQQQQKPPPKKLVKPRSKRLVLDATMINNLVLMGFPVAACRKAVFYTLGKGMHAARNWLVEHMDDVDFATPLDESLLNLPGSDEPTKPTKSRERSSSTSENEHSEHHGSEQEGEQAPHPNGTEGEWYGKEEDGEGVGSEGETDTHAAEQGAGGEYGDHAMEEAQAQDEHQEGHENYDDHMDDSKHIDEQPLDETGQSHAAEGEEAEESNRKRQRTDSPDNDLMAITGVKRLKTDEEEGSELAGWVAEAQEMVAHPDADHVAYDRVVALMTNVLHALDQQGASQGQVDALAHWVVWLLDNHPHFLAGDSQDGGQVQMHRYDRLFELLLGAGDGQPGGGPWLLHVLHGQKPDVGVCLLHYLQTRQLKGDYYMAFCATFMDSGLGFVECVVRDIEQCSDYVLQGQLMDHIMRTMHVAAGSHVLIRWLLSTINGSQLYRLVCDTKLGQVRLFRNSTTQEVIEQSLEWETLECNHLWQLLHVEALRGNRHLATLLPAILPHIDPTTHVEALTGLLLFLSAVPPEPPLLQALLGLGSHYSPFPACALAQWLGSPYAAALGPGLHTALQGAGPDIINNALLHVDTFCMASLDADEKILAGLRKALQELQHDPHTHPGIAAIMAQ